MIVLDTHALIWMVEDSRRLGPNARQIIEDASARDGLLVAAITPWEVALLNEKGRLALGRDVGEWIASALAAPGVRLAPLVPAIAVDSIRLPGDVHADPADRMIIATARHHDATLLTADRAILAYASAGHVKAIDAER